MCIDARRLQIGMAECLRDKGDRRPVVDGVRGVGMAQPMRRRVRVDAGPFGDRLQDVVDAAFCDRKHTRRAWRPAAHCAQILGDLGRQQHVPGFVAFADEGELHLAGFAGDDLTPRQRRGSACA